MQILALQKGHFEARCSFLIFSSSSNLMKQVDTSISWGWPKKEGQGRAEDAKNHTRLGPRPIRLIISSHDLIYVIKGMESHFNITNNSASLLALGVDMSI